MERAHNPVRAARRESELRERLGCANPSCILCGYSVLTGLRRVSRTWLEEHHVLGRAHDSHVCVILCYNCHAEATERQRDAGVEFRRQTDPIERVIAELRSLATFFEMLAPALQRMAEGLEESP